MVMVNPIWRVLIASNQDEESLGTLPPLVNSIEDKILLLQANSFPLPMPDADRDTQWRAIKAEIPAFAWYLVNKVKVPEELKDQRFGVKTFHHPELKQALDDIDPAQALPEVLEHLPDMDADLALLDMENEPPTLPKGEVVWAGTATELIEKLRTVPQ